MKRLAILLSFLAVSFVARADEPMCATGPANDERLRALHDRPHSRARIAANGELVPVVRDGAFYVETDELIAPGYHPNDLEGASLVFEPRSGGRFAARRTALQYVEPQGEPLKDFQAQTSGAGWYWAEVNINSFLFPFFGTNNARLFVSAFNGITFVPPAEETAMQFDAVEAAVHREALLSPLMITISKPTRLHYPKVYVSQTADYVLVTWRSTTGPVFRYDVQALLRRDGSITYSYRSLGQMRWGAPVVSAGFDPATVISRTLTGINDTANDIPSSAIAALRGMADLRRVEVTRLNESELFAIRLQLGTPINRSLFAEGQSLRYIVQLGSAVAQLDVLASTHTISTFYSSTTATNGASARIDGNLVELYGLQLPPDAATTQTLRVWTYTRPTTNVADFASVDVPFDVPSKRIATDLSGASSQELALPITEPFTLGAFDPRGLWERLQAKYALSDYEIDAVAMYQTFFTDLIYYAGAYSTAGNPQVDGIRPPSTSVGTKVPRSPALLHMNQLTYGWNAATELSSHVMMHELGHRWLYFFSIMEDGQKKRALNPISAHPGAFVHTPAAFNVFGADESSVMGGSHFTQLPEGTFRAHAANYGYSWTDLYLMGLATPEEVAPWFYIQDSNPALPLAYYATEGIVVSGARKPVTIDQVIASEGPRNPTTATSQRLIRVLFVLVTEPGAAPTDEQVAKVNEWRSILEKNFEIATGGRAKVETAWVRPTKRRAAR